MYPVFHKETQGIHLAEVEARGKRGQTQKVPGNLSWVPLDKGPLLNTDKWKIITAIEQDLHTAFFSDQAIAHARARAFFTTEEGYIGTAGSMIEIGDRIALISGVSVPLVLRMDEGGINHFRLISKGFILFEKSHPFG